jgi:hypothetical protein
VRNESIKLFAEKEIKTRMNKEEMEKEKEEELMRKSSLKSKYSKRSQPDLYSFSSPRLVT